MLQFITDRFYKQILRINLLALAAITLAFFLIAANSVAAKKDQAPILLGMTTALSGPAGDLGRNMKIGVETYLREINALGGVNGRKLKLIALDDGYEPESAKENMLKLVADKGIVAIIGNVGTPTARVTAPIAIKEKVLLFGAFTGAGEPLRRDPPDRYIINFRASYAQETKEMIGGLLQIGVRPNEIAFFTQKDGYGDSGYLGAINALKKKGYVNTVSLAHGRYKRNTMNVESAIVEIVNGFVEPKAIIMVGTYMPVSKFINMYKPSFPNTYFLNVSFVGSKALLKTLGSNAENIIVTQVVPYFDSDLPGVKRYRKALKKFFPASSPGFVSLEGYLAARVFVEGLKAVKGRPDREKVIDGLHTLDKVDIGIGVNITINEKKHQALNRVWPSIIRKLKSKKGETFRFEPYSFIKDDLDNSN